MSLLDLESLVEKHDYDGSSVGWLKGLSDDGHSVEGRIMVKGRTGEENGKVMFDLPVFEVHEYEIDGFNRDVKCTGDDACKMCRHGNKPRLKLYLPIYRQGEEKEVQIWKRGISDIKRLLALNTEYGDLNARNVKIQRVGKKGSTKTTYEYFFKDKSEVELPQLPEICSDTSWFVLDLTDAQIDQLLSGRLTLKKEVMPNTSNTQSSNANARNDVALF